jgi:EF-P beta-lysylation protein EpmB
MRKGDPDDPLLRQVLPVHHELQDAPGFAEDAVGDLTAVRPGGILHKYRGRALLIVTGACAVHCRYCFRRHFPYNEHSAARDAWRGALDALGSDTSIDEVILSGGDPLTLSDRRLAGLTQALDAIPHLKRLRIHTRLPVVLPERVDDALLAWLMHGRLRRIVVIHANHARELDASVERACRRLLDTGITLLNQSVLLRGINEDAGVLATLSERLFECGVMPYYLHQLDRVRGTAHFEVDEATAVGIMRDLAGRLPGYLVPRLVREEAGRPYKLPVAW